jgi:hypothetical protein
MSEFLVMLAVRAEPSALTGAFPIQLFAELAVP